MKTARPKITGMALAMVATSFLALTSANAALSVNVNFDYSKTWCRMSRGALPSTLPSCHPTASGPVSSWSKSSER